MTENVIENAVFSCNKFILKKYSQVQIMLNHTAHAISMLML